VEVTAGGLVVGGDDPAVERFVGIGDVGVPLEHGQPPVEIVSPDELAEIMPDKKIMRDVLRGKVKLEKAVKEHQAFEKAQDLLKQLNAVGFKAA